MKHLTLRTVATTLLSASLSSAAMAGGFDRGGVNVDQLFDPERFTASAGVTYVNPQRDLDNVTRGANVAGPFPVAVTPGLSVDGDYVVPHFGIKGSVGDLSCLATYTEPFGADAGYGTGNAFSATAVSFEIDTRDYGLTCGYRFSAGSTSFGDGYLRLIGGVSYQQLEGLQERQTFLDFANLGVAGVGGVSNTAGIGFFDVDGDAVGWRAGIAYEIPQSAIRALLLYHSRYNYDLSGVQNNTGFGALIPGTAIVPVSISTEIPQALELKLQSGINEQTIAFFNFKWQDWSQLGVIPIVGGLSPVTGAPSLLSFDPLYRDGLTVSAGIGRVITDDLAGRVGIGWDRGTSTISGAQTDTWTLSGGVRWTPNENVELSVGGLVGLLTSGTSLPSGGDQANNITYSFDDDIVTAVNGSLKIKF